jgi:limonene-1,2-epoxide hydrolase
MVSTVSRLNVSPNLTVVRNTLDAFCQLDADAALSHFADEAVWLSPPLPLLRGKKSVERALRLLLRVLRSYAYRDALWAIDGDRVFVERTEDMSFGPFHVELPVNSVIELRDGKVVAWRDYYDSISFLLSLLRSR